MTDSEVRFFTGLASVQLFFWLLKVCGQFSLSVSEMTDSEVRFFTGLASVQLFFWLLKVCG